MNLKSYFLNHFVVGLSPMDGYTDEPFRQVLAEIAPPDVYFTEFVSAEGLSRGGVRLYDVLLYSPNERPIIGQLFGKDPESFYKSAIVLCHLGFDGVDINLGCQAKRITQHGSGGALIGKPDLASEIIKATKLGVDDWFNHKITIDDLKLNQKTLEAIDRNLKYSGVPKNETKPTVSVKTRLGINQIITDTWIPFLLKHNLDFLTLHGRIVTQGHGGGVANWDEIHKAAIMAHEANTIILGNGDIQSRQQGLEYCQKYGVNGVLIGRASLGNPWVFSDHKASPEEKFHAMATHAYHFRQVFPHRQFDVLRKHFLLYASGHPHAKALRDKLVHLSSLDQLYAIEADFLNC